MQNKSFNDIVSGKSLDVSSRYEKGHKFIIHIGGHKPVASQASESYRLDPNRSNSASSKSSDKTGGIFDKNSEEKPDENNNDSQGEIRERQSQGYLQPPKLNNNSKKDTDRSEVTSNGKMPMFTNDKRKLINIIILFF